MTHHRSRRLVGGGRLLLATLLLLSAACASTREQTELEFGPPPPGFIKIRGEAVPGWQASDLRLQRRSTVDWQLMGPRPITGEFWSGDDDASGRVVDIAVDPSNPLRAYIASASGGIWRTLDGGASWIPLTDELPNLNHGCVALDPSDPQVVWAGTGEYTTQSAGDGVFRSPDGGGSWVRAATTAQVGITCSQLLVDPTDSDTVHLTGAAGYSRTTDGGTSWVSTLSGAASGLAMDAGDPLRLYLGRHGDGIYRSLDGGSAWTRLSVGLPTSDVQRIVLAAAPSQAGRVFAAIVNGAAGLRGLYRTDDGGDTWSQLSNTPNFPSPQGWYDTFVGVSPTDADEVWAGGVFPSYAVAGVIRSTDGGDSWDDVTVGTLGGQVHPDQHAVAFGPDGSVWVGSDGGIWRTLDAGTTWLALNNQLTITQNYNIALHPRNPDLVMGGTQDNGTAERVSGDLSWPQLIGGDGGFLAYDHDQPTRRYSTYVRLAVFRFNGASFAEITGPWSNDRRSFISPLVMDPNDSKTLLGGTYRVWRTNNADGAAAWSSISNDLSGGAGGVLNAIAVAPGDSNAIYTGSSRGKVFATTGGLWVDRSAGLPSGEVSDLAVDPTDSAVAYVAFHNTSGPRVLRTEDRGASWQDVTGALPSGVSARALAVEWRTEPPLLFVGTGVGVYWSLDGGASWEKDGADLPNVNIGDLVVDPTRDLIVAGTYGRGAWRGMLTALLGRTPIFTDGFESGDGTSWTVVSGP